MTAPTPSSDLTVLSSFVRSAHGLARDTGDAPELARWQELLAQAGRELAEPLTAALERVATLTTTGHIDRAGLRTLLDEVDRARQTGIWCQQIVRLASGHVRQTHERLHLTHTLQSVLAHRARELQARGIHVTPTLQEVEVQIDASMLHGLLNALVEWWLGCAQGVVDVHLDNATHARLTCQFQLAPGNPHPALDSMSWHLLEQTARALGMVHERQVRSSQVHVSLEFPRALPTTWATGNGAIMGDTGFADSVNSQPLAGSHVLVVAAHRDMRVLVRESIQSMGLVVDFVSSVGEAVDFCQEGLPHCIVFEAGLKTPRFAHLMDSIRGEVPEFVFIELLDSGEQFDMSSTSDTGMARVGRDAVPTSLPSALIYELTRTM